MLTPLSQRLIAGGIAVLILIGLRVTYMIKHSGIYWSEYIAGLAKNPLNL